MDKILASSMFGWARLLLSIVTCIVGLFAELKDEKILGMGSTAWLLLTVIYCFSLVLHFQAKQCLKMK